MVSLVLPCGFFLQSLVPSLSLSLSRSSSLSFFSLSCVRTFAPLLRCFIIQLNFFLLLLTLLCIHLIFNAAAAAGWLKSFYNFIVVFFSILFYLVLFLFLFFGEIFVHVCIGARMLHTAHLSACMCAIVKLCSIHAAAAAVICLYCMSMSLSPSVFARNRALMCHSLKFIENPCVPWN